MNRFSFMQRLPLFALLLSTLALMACEPTKDITIVYDDAEGLEEGAPVLYHGVEVGTVTDISLHERPNRRERVVHVSTSLDANESDKFTHQMAFTIERDRSSNRPYRIVIKDPNRRSDRRYRIEDGDLVIGTEEALDAVFDFSEDIARAVEDALRDVEINVDLGQLVEDLDLEGVLRDARIAIEENLDEEELDTLIEELEVAADELSQELSYELEEAAARLKRKH